MRKAEKISIQKALADTEGMKRAIVAGNGLSIALSPEFKKDTEWVNKASEAINNISKDTRINDINQFVDLLENFRKCISSCNISGDKGEVRTELTKLLLEARNSYFEMVAGSHYNGTGSLYKSDRMKRAMEFFKKFQLRATLCYDLAFYWMNRIDNGTDGFGRASGESVLKFNPNKKPNCLYLNGGVHFFSPTSSSEKKTLLKEESLKDEDGNTYKELYKVIEERIINKKDSPVILIGDEEKARSRKDNIYFLKAFERLEFAEEIQALFVYATSFRDDKHVVNTLLRNNHLKRVYINDYVDEDTNHRFGVEAAKLFEKENLEVTLIEHFNPWDDPIFFSKDKKAG